MKICQGRNASKSSPRATDGTNSPDSFKVRCHWFCKIWWIQIRAGTDTGYCITKGPVAPHDWPSPCWLSRWCATIRHQIGLARRLAITGTGYPGIWRWPPRPAPLQLTSLWAPVPAWPECFHRCKAGIFNAVMLNHTHLLRDVIELFSVFSTDFYQMCAVMGADEFDFRKFRTHDFVR